MPEEIVEDVVTDETPPIETVPEVTPPPIVPPTPPLDIAQIIKESRIDPHVLAQAIAQANAQALAPLMPKPPESPKSWESDDFLENPQVFRQAIGAWQEHNLKQFEQAKLAPLIQELQAIKNILPTLYARSAENPNFGVIQSRANELVSEFGIPHMTALAMAQKEISKTPTPKIVSPPKHASTPDTRQSTLTDTDELPSGPANFRDIIKGLTASGKYTL